MILAIGNDGQFLARSAAQVALNGHGRAASPPMPRAWRTARAAAPRCAKSLAARHARVDRAGWSRQCRALVIPSTR